MKKSIDQRIEALESHFKSPQGTQIVRSFDSNHSKIQWTLAFGQMGMPKMFFMSNSIEGCVRMAEMTINQEN